MSATIVLDQHYSTFTNLDVISGKVVVRTYKSLSLSTIIVKLEGESSTRLLPPPTPGNERPRPSIEFHKILYRTITLFPPPELAQRADARLQFTLPPGTHEYPFSFKIPFNAACALDKNATPAISVSGLNLEIARPPPSHLRRPLPPTLRGFPGEAEIRYFLKATVTRPGILRENVRAFVPFTFSPIDPPRQKSDGSEAYARQKHQFHQPPTGPTDARPVAKTKRSMFSIKSHSSDEKTEKQPAASAPFLLVEMRLPEPKILTSNEDVPLRMLVTTLNEQTEGMYLHNLQVEIAYNTHVRAHQVHHNNAGSVVLTSKSNLDIPLEFGDKGEAMVPAELWYGMPVPSQLPPSFEICNLSRDYVLLVRAGLRWQPEKAPPQYTHVELRLPFALFSGITPPPEVLATYKRKPVPFPSPTGTDQKAPPLPARMPSAPSTTTDPAPHQHASSATSSGPSNTPVTTAPFVPGAFPHPSSHNNIVGPPRYSGPGTASGPQQSTTTTLWTDFPAGMGTSLPPVEGEVYSDAPPSYEDAVAEHLPPVQVGEGGRRGGYRPVGEAGGEEGAVVVAGAAAAAAAGKR